MIKKLLRKLFGRKGATVKEESGTYSAGNGKPGYRSYTFPDIRKVSLRGTITCVIEHSGANSVQIKTDENIIKFVQCEMDGSMLHISTSGAAVSTMGIQVTIQAETIDEIVNSGFVDCSIRNCLMKKLLFNNSGKAALSIESNIGNLIIKSTGSLDIDIAKLEFMNVHMDLNGSGELVITENEKIGYSGMFKYVRSIDAQNHPQFFVSSNNGHLRCS
jgi:hypothetical protein